MMLSKKYDFVTSEEKWQKFWQEQAIYHWDENESRENTFVVDTPPPTVSGQLHIGHVFSYTQTDFIVRYQRMTGKNIFYPMGFDDNGLPTERLVEKKRKVKASQTDRQEFIEICKEVVKDEEDKFRNLFSKIALSVDWRQEFQTISPRSRKLSQLSFLDLAEKNQVYRSDQPMIWDPIDQTALAQAEIEDKERDSLMNEIIFTTEKGEKLKIATTRPELLPACVAVLYHPDDERYKHLEGQYAFSPLFNQKCKLIADDLVKMDKGTGLVMCCTFGDSTDIIWWQKHKLDLKIIMSKVGKILPLEYSNPQIQNYADQLAGLKIKDARVKIIELLKTDDLLVKQDPIVQTVKCAERSGAPLEILSTKQWFIKTIEHQDALKSRSEELNWHPKSMKIRLDSWIESLSWDWCISRQRFFGVPFPVWYSKRPGEEGKIIFAESDQLPVDPTKDLPKGYSREEVEADKDVMDTWATSSISPSLSSYGINDDNAIDAERYKKLTPADLRPQAHEIIRVWAFYTILKSHLHNDSLPWKNIMISGWCLAEDKSKMSKSKGNIIDPEMIIKQYGTDVIRYWSGNSKLGNDTAYSEDVVKNGKRLVNKLWNAAKFITTHLENLKTPIANDNITHITDKWLITKLAKLIDNCTNAFEKYEYAQALWSIEEFFWQDFCDNYLEISKKRAYNESGDNNSGQQSSITTLYITLETILKLLAPFMPHVTEEIYQTIYKSNQSIHSRGNWPKADNFNIDEMALKQGEELVAILELVRKAKAEKNLSIKSPLAELNFIANQPLDDSAKQDLAAVTSANKVTQASSEIKTNFEQQFTNENGIAIGLNYQA